SLSSDYDVVLIPNFLHHFDFTTCVAFLRKTHAALRSGGRVAIVEFVVNEDRVTPPETAGFSLGMLASTPSGDAYTLRELAEMLENAGFTGVDHRLLPPGVATAIIARK
ncbi:MAG TPA: methyltransferase, partial [Chthoniobacterales bacterium]|nr:methyltransferase [Chthoniobacterales bacterium]